MYLYVLAGLGQLPQQQTLAKAPVYVFLAIPWCEAVALSRADPHFYMPPE